ncbi:MAG: hypothetical protein ABEI80_09120 [Haloplanus sp.]
MHRRTLLSACGIGLVGAPGCLSTSSDGGGATPTETPTGGTPTDVPNEDVIAYDALTPKQREAFEAARDDVVRFSTGVPGLDKPIQYGLGVFVPFREHEYVRKNGELYRLKTGRSGFIGGIRVEVTPIERSPSDAIPLGERSGDGVELIKRAIETDGDAARIRVDMPDDITVETIVEYRGDYYRITQLSNRDYEYFTLTVEGPS